CVVIEIPIEAIDVSQALRILQAQSAQVGQEYQQGRQTLSAFNDAEFPRLLDGVHDVGAAVGKGHDVGLRTLCLQQVGSEVRHVKRMQYRAHHRAAQRLDHVFGALLQRMAESVVNGDEEP